MSLTKFLPCPVGTVTRKTLAGGSKTGAGKNENFLVGREGSFIYTSYLKPTLDWSGVGKIIRATLVVYTAGAGVSIPEANTPRVNIRRVVTSNFTEGTHATFNSGDYTAPPVTGSVVAGMTRAAEGVNRIDITGYMNIWATKGVKQSSGAAGTNPGTGTKRTDRGLALVGVSTAAKYAWTGWSDDAASPYDAYTPVIELEYEPGLTEPDVPTNLLPFGDTDNLNFEGDFTDSRPQDKLASTDIELYPGSGGKSATIATSDIVTSAAHGLATSTPIIFLSLTGGTGLAINTVYYVRDVTTNTFKVALTAGGAAINVTVAASAAKWVRRIWATPVSYPATETDSTNGHFIVIPSGLTAVAGTAYKFRARVHDDSGSVSPWSALQGFTLTNNPPFAPVITPDGESYASLNGVVFKGVFSDTDPDTLGAYQIQLASAPPDDDFEELNFWDTGRVAVPLIVDGIFRVPYSGTALLAGDYNWRSRVWDDRGAVSDWSYATITLTEDFDPEPGSQTTRQIDPEAPWRIRIMAMERLAFGGNVAGTASNDLLVSSSAHGLKVDNTVYLLTKTGGTGLVIGTPYYVLPGGLTTTHFKVSLSPRGVTVNFSTNLTASTWARATRGPGELLCVMENAKSVGGSKMYNSPGEAHWTLPVDDPRVRDIEPKQTHYAIDFYSGDGWRETFAGLVWDVDATETSIVYTGIDYLSLFDLNGDERFSVSRPDLPTTKGGNKYVKTSIHDIATQALTLNINLPDSPTGFISLGSITTAMTEKTTIYAAFIPTLQFITGLMDSHKQGTGKNTRISVYRDTTGHYKVKIEDAPGIVRDDLRMKYGEMVQGFRVIAFGSNWLDRINSIGRVRDGVKVMYKLANAPGISQAVYGRISQVRVFDGVTDENDMLRRQKQTVLHASKLGSAMALGYRNGVLQPMDGYDVTDQIPVEVVWGAIDTTRFGSGFWIIYGVTWEANDDGSSATTLTLLPRDDTEAPDEDLLESAPTQTNEWRLISGPPPSGTFSTVQTAKSPGYVAYPTVTFDNPLTIGNFVVVGFLLAQSGISDPAAWGTPDLGPGWTVSPNFGITGGGSNGLWMAYKEVEAGDSATIEAIVLHDGAIDTSNNGMMVAAEFSTGGVTPTETDSDPDTNTVGSATHTIPEVHPTQYLAALVIGLVAHHPDYNQSVSTGWTNEEEFLTGGGPRQGLALISLKAAASTGSYTGVVTNGGGTDTDLMLVPTVAFSGSF